MSEKFDARTYADIIKKYNPFGFKEPNGSSSTFVDYGELYYYVMVKMVSDFPRGYIDISLFLVWEMNIEIRDACRIFKKHLRKWFQKDVILVELWDNDSRERDYFFRSLLSGLHAYSDTKFSESYYRNAICKFNERNDKLKLESRTVNGSILDATANI